MISDAAGPASKPRRWWPWLLLLLALPGCRGCRGDGLAENDKKSDQQQLEKPKEDFQMPSCVTVPHDASFAFPTAKPGHWVTVRHEVVANNFDFSGELWTASSNNAGVPFEVENTRFQLRAVRPAPLPKGESRFLDVNYYIPHVASDSPSTGVWLWAEVRGMRGGRTVEGDANKVYTMPAYQYYLLVLADEPDRYGYLKHLTSVSAPTSDDLGLDSWLYYRVLLPPIDRFAPLPAHSLTWSSIAYIVWDDIDPAILTAEQEQGLLDWLHWGGQLVISGPRSLEKMRGKFLEALLPALPEGLMEVDPLALRELNGHWSLVDARTDQPLEVSVAPGQPLVAVRLRKAAEADFLPGTGELVAERRVGAGRIVVTAFSLTDRAIVNWGSFDSFFNACLLRRPRRSFEAHQMMANTRLADYHPTLAGDSRVTTTLRYFTRDIGHFTAGPQGLEPTEEPLPLYAGDSSAAGPLVSPEPRVAEQPQPRDAAGTEVASDVPARNPRDGTPHFNGYPHRITGVAGWNDRSGASDAARQALKDAAGISIPRGRFVLRVLLVYLVVLVPLNWAVFRSVGRVEWAWFAAPLIAVVAAVAVVRFAQLNIGFARSVTELSVVELQAGYPRAHVTRYMALYTSLSTSYSLEFDPSADTLAQPFGAATDYHRSASDPVSTVTLRRDRRFRMENFQVSSNKTGIVHCEQMCHLGGSVRLTRDADAGYRLHNDTLLQLRDAGVLHRTEDGRLQGAYLGDVPAGNSVPVLLQQNLRIPHLPQWTSPAVLSYEMQQRALLRQYDSDGDGRLQRNEARGELATQFARLDRDGDQVWDASEIIAWCRLSRAGELSLGQMVELASQGLVIAPGEMRLVGWTDTPIGGLSIRPGAAQESSRTLVLVHLLRGSLPLPRPDLNRKADVVDETITADAESAEDDGAP